MDTDDSWPSRVRRDGRDRGRGAGRTRAASDPSRVDAEADDVANDPHLRARLLHDSPNTRAAAEHADTSTETHPDGEAVGTGGTGGTGAAAPSPSPPAFDRRVVWVHRVGAGLVAVVIAVFGVLGLAGGLSFFDTRGTPVLGLSSNGLLSTISLTTAVVLVVAAVRAGRTASSVMIVIGVLFLAAGMGHLAILGTPVNVLAFRLPNVFFSLAAGMVLLFTGAYGRLTARAPADNPYLQAGDRIMTRAAAGLSETATHTAPPDTQPRPATDVEHAADAAMAAAEHAVAEGSATAGQRRGVQAMNPYRRHEDRRRTWLNTNTTSSATNDTGRTDDTDIDADTTGRPR